MPLNLASPGIIVKEIDLTNGRVDPTSTKSGGLVAPFAKGPVEKPTLIETEADLLDTFGSPYRDSNHYEYWLTASSYLAYGGVLQVVRSNESGLKNAFVGTASSVIIKSGDDYVTKGYAENNISNVVFAAKNPGSWGNGLKVAMIDGLADQILTGIATVSVLGFSSTANGGLAAVAGYEDGLAPIDLTVGLGVTQAIPANTVIAGAGSTSVLDGYLKGVITEVGTGQISVKVVSHVSAAGTETSVDYTPGGVYAFTETGNASGGIHVHVQSAIGSGKLGWQASTVSYGSSFGNTNFLSALTGAGVTVGDNRYLAAQEFAPGTLDYTGEKDWFDSQWFTLTDGEKIYWNNLAERPGTSNYAKERNSKNDEVHVVVYDDSGKITGNAGTLLDKFTTTSKAKDAIYSVGNAQYYRKVIEIGSPNIFAGGAPSGVITTDLDADFNPVSDVAWDQDTENISFAAIGNYVASLSGGTDYGGKATIDTTDALKVTVGDLSEGYDLLANKDAYPLDFLIMGSGAHGKEETQALANKLIAVAEIRKDCVACISPHRQAFLASSGDGEDLTLKSDTITSAIISFYSAISSSSYAIFDSGYKYMYDRFSKQFRYVPLNGDIAGICARNDINNFPWFSPGGTQRGSILNAVKLAYNPTQVERDKLYSSRVNPIIFSPGAGIILFGDKTGLGRASAFDRINVRRLFIFLEKAIAAAAKDQLFEFNDEITRINFINIVEPFLRDVQSKRGITDFVLVCDETNNTAAIIDSNEFVADIYIKPARSINFIGLTFVATRTGVSFEEVIGRV
tara:strand:- start:1475 stop:3856 length:2382 start_codon:yes stop_codon:yes gene_type:complete